MESLEICFRLVLPPEHPFQINRLRTVVEDLFSSYAQRGIAFFFKDFFCIPGINYLLKQNGSIQQEFRFKDSIQDELQVLQIFTLRKFLSKLIGDFAKIPLKINWRNKLDLPFG